MQLFGVPEVCHTLLTHLHPVLRQVVYFIYLTHPVDASLDGVVFHSGENSNF